MIKKITVIIPVIRPENVEKLKQDVFQMSGIEKDDENYDIELILKEDSESIGCPKMVNLLTQGSDSELVCFLGDDVEPQKDYLIEALKVMETFKDGWGVVGFNDDPNKNKSHHFLIHKNAIREILDGEFFHEGYHHCFCDDELILRANIAKRYKYAEKAILKHNHPIYKEGEEKVEDKIKSSGDDKLIKAYSHYREDEALFHKRMSEEYKKAKPAKKPTKVAICIPSGDMIHTDFALSLIDLIKYSSQYVQCFVINHKTSLLQVGRAELIEQAMRQDADYIFFMDSDMMIHYMSLIRMMGLLGEDKDFICLDAVRRKAPYDTVLLDLNDKPLEYPEKKEEDPDSELVEIKGITTAVALIKVSAIKKIKRPYFLVPYIDKNKYKGEDRYFGDKLREAGIKCYCDLDLSRYVKHLGISHFSIDNRPEMK